jgi:hypothetical protein
MTTTSSARIPSVIAGVLALVGLAVSSPTIANAAELPDEIGAEWDRGGTVSTTVGRLFFVTDEDGAPVESSCSANVVESANRSVIMTAAHCAFGHDYRFVPGYHDGQTPYGTWPIRSVFAPEQPSLRADYAAMTVGTVDGRRIQDVVGATPVRFDGGPSERTAVFGYPRERTNEPDRPYGGRTLTYSVGVTQRDDLGRPGTASDMSRGASGGPLFAGFDPETGAGVQIAAVSGQRCVVSDDEGDCLEKERALYGALFDEGARRLHERASAM